MTSSSNSRLGGLKPRVLTLPVKKVYFDQMRAGTKLFEYRLRTEYWTKRLVGREYDHVCITCGYPKTSEADRRLVVSWNGYELQTLTHEFFGPEPVAVFAIHVDASDHTKEQDA